MMEDSMKDMMDEYLPLRDVVFRTLRRAILKGAYSIYSFIMIYPPRRV